MSLQLRAALIRGLIGAFFIFWLTFFTTLQSAPGLRPGQTLGAAAAVNGAVAALTYIVGRGGIEGLMTMHATSRATRNWGRDPR